MFNRAFFISILLSVITCGCIEYQHKTVYQDKDVKVIFHQPLTVMKMDNLTGEMILTVAGRSYKLADCIDGAEGGCKGFLKTPDASAIVFAVQEGKEWRPLMSSTLHIVNLKTKSDTSVPLNIQWIGSNPHISIKSFDGHQLVLFVNSEDSFDSSGNLQIDLDAKQVLKFDRTKDAVQKTTLPR